MDESLDLEDSRVAAFSHKSSKRASPEPVLASETVGDADSVHRSKRRRRTPKNAAASGASALLPGTNNAITTNHGKFFSFGMLVVARIVAIIPPAFSTRYYFLPLKQMKMVSII
jgi:hypothetical protein